MNIGKIPEILVRTETIDLVYKDGRVDNPTANIYPTNSYFVLRSQTDSQKTAVVKFEGDHFQKVNLKRATNIGVTPKDVKQACLVDSLFNKDIFISVGIGAAGTGKTTLALAYAVSQLQELDRSVFLTKPATYIGNARAFGPVPGDVNEKYAPFLASYDIVLKKILGDHGRDAMEQLVKKERLKFIPIEYARGCTFENCTFIIDEAQNLTWHELNSIVSRVGENSKLILLGDPNQIDIRMPVSETGLSLFCNSQAFHSSPITSAVQLTEQYRSKIAELVIRVDRELREEIDEKQSRRSS